MNPPSLLDARKAARAAKHRQDDALRALHERALALVSDQSHAPAIMASALAAIAFNIANPSACSFIGNPPLSYFVARREMQFSPVQRACADLPPRP